MNLIHQNPYRIAGILAGVSERELKKQQSKLKAFAKVGKEANLDVDFPFLRQVSRNESAVAHAIAAIEQGRDRVDNALFWFVKVTALMHVQLEAWLPGRPERLHWKTLKFLCTGEDLLPNLERSLTKSYKPFVTT
jgi:hypothetical protein